MKDTLEEGELFALCRRRLDLGGLASPLPALTFDLDVKSSRKEENWSK